MAPLRDIDVGLLRAFVAVAETGRMSLAARFVNRSQGAVSQQIARLETLFGARLFERRADGVRPTRDGERLLIGAYRLIAANDELVAHMRGAEVAGEVRLGVPPDVVAALVPPVLRAFRERRPGVLVTLVSEGTRALRRAVADGAIDLALATEAVAGDGDGLLLEDRLVWVGAPDGNAHRRRPLPVALGREDCAFRASAVGALTRAGIEWRAICQVGSLEPVFATLEADLAVGAFLSRTVPDRLTALGRGHGLPRLPACYVNLLLPPTGVGTTAAELALCLREHFAQT